MAVNLSPIGNDAPFVDASGNPLTGGLLYTYLAGSSTPETTYTTQGGSTANANPVVLNANGYPASAGNVVEIWLTAGIEYKFTLKTSAGVEVWTRDDIQGINDTTAFSQAGEQWVLSALTPTYISATSFSVTGDQTAVFQANRRIKSTNTGGTIYSRIKSSSFGAVTTVTVVNDSGTLDSGLSAVSLGILTPINPSVPPAIDTFPIVSGSSDKTKLLRFEVDGFTTDTTRVVTVPDADLTMGYQNIPINSQSAAYTTVALDAGKTILHPAADTNARTFTIDSNANVPYALGTAITFVNETANVVTIAITSDTLTLAGTTSTGSRSLAQNGLATAVKVTTTKWIIAGTGLS